MKELQMQPEPTPTILLSITSSESHRKKWFEDCQKLYYEIALNLEPGQVRPMKTAVNSGERGLTELFQNLVLTGINLGVFAGLYNLLKLWVENKKTSEVTIKYPDGFTLTVSRISLEEALEMHKKHRRQNPEIILTETNDN
jgi:hypothetical protein